MTTHPRSIVVGVDDSAASQAAVHWAAREAARRRIGLTLVRAYSTPTYGVPLVGMVPVAPFTAARDEAMRVLREATETAAESAPAVAVSTLAINGSAAAVIADEASRAEMVVIGTEGRHQFTGVSLGAVASRLAGTIATPLVIVRSRHSGPESDDRPVLVASDGSPASQGAVEFAFDLASRRQVPLIAARVWDDSVFDGYQRVYPLPVDRAQVDRDEAAALAEELSSWEEKYPNVDTAHLVLRGHPAGTAIDRLETTGHELSEPGAIVVGSRGRGGFRGLILGSTSHALIAHAACPVIVVRPVDHHHATRS
jgi:nucleotide-binding universal stress UspA family protein